MPCIQLLGLLFLRLECQLHGRFNLVSQQVYGGRKITDFESLVIIAQAIVAQVIVVQVIVA
jgi:hypothetical protein